MTTKQPEALRLAKSISRMDTFTEYQRAELDKAAAALRRLHAENEALRRMSFDGKYDEVRAENEALKRMAGDREHCDQTPMTMQQQHRRGMY